MSSFGNFGSAELPVAGPKGDDEMDEVQLMCEVQSLETQLSHVDPVHEKFALMFMQSLESNPLSEQIRKLKVRRNHLQNNGRPLPSTSTIPAVLPAVARNRNDLETPEKAAIDVDDRGSMNIVARPDPFIRLSHLAMPGT
jgi:hypothetical protein